MKTDWTDWAFVVLLLAFTVAVVSLVHRPCECHSPPPRSEACATYAPCDSRCREIYEYQAYNLRSGAL